MIQRDAKQLVINTRSLSQWSWHLWQGLANASLMRPIFGMRALRMCLAIRATPN